jgi:hypothetical protein
MICETTEERVERSRSQSGFTSTELYWSTFAKRPSPPRGQLANLIQEQGAFVGKLKAAPLTCPNSSLSSSPPESRRSSP